MKSVHTPPTIALVLICVLLLGNILFNFYVIKGQAESRNAMQQEIIALHNCIDDPTLMGCGDPFYK